LLVLYLYSVRIFSCLLFLVGSFGVSAQAVQPDSVSKNRYRSIIKVSPFHLVNFYPSVQLAYELQFPKNYSLQLDAGYVFDLEETSDMYKNKRGVKLKTELRYYIETKKRARLLYVSFEPYANLINFDRNEFKTECFDVECTVLFRREYNYLVRYRETGASFKLGIQMQRKRFLFDFNHGLMVRNINYKKPFIPAGIDDNIIRIWNIFPNEEKRIVLGPVVGIRAGYLLSK